MKQGDKVWFYENLGKTINEGVITKIQDIGATVEWDAYGQHCSSFWLLAELFPSREALCEHYRKIFE